MKRSLSAKQKALIRRYLIWAYKSTREGFERIERKTTQLIVDEYILSALSKKKTVAQDALYAKDVEDFKQYIANKREDELKQKYTAQGKGQLNGHYCYLQDRLTAIEGAIKEFLGLKALKEVERMFEAEFTRRILESKDH